jgi:UDP-glucose 4-epimerase
MRPKISRVLVTGGAGYIGSHTTRRLIEAGYEITVVDTLYSGHRWAIPEEVDFHQLDAGDVDGVTRLLKKGHIEAIIHFAGHIVVPESVQNPTKYYRNNVIASMNLISACQRSGVELFVFSSSAAVYGNPEKVPVTEETTTLPINPYGRTKLITEWNLRDVATSSQLSANGEFRFVALRYFNVAGAQPDGTLGQATPEATHLIKVACETALNKRESVAIFGTDYDTPDGTCVRDYIHVQDLATAHLDALQYLANGGPSETLNCGYGRGYSVREVLAMVRTVSGVDFPIIEVPRRPGDSAQLIADNQRILKVLGWLPQHDDLKEICRTAWEWERRYQDNSTTTAQVIKLG